MPELSNQIFKINDLTVDSSLNKLTYLDNTEVIEGRLMSFLVYLAERTGETVSLEDIIRDVWQGQVVSNNAVYRVVAALRKILINKFNSPDIITTVTKKGYRLEAKITILEQDALLPNNKTSSPLFKIILVIALIFGIISLTLYFSASNGKIKVTTTGEATNPSVKPITSLQGKEFMPVVSPNGKYLLFSHSKLKSTFFNLYLQVLEKTDSEINNQNKQQSIQLTNEDALILSASWSPDGQSIVYQKTANGLCNIMLADFNSISLSLSNHRVFTNCRNTFPSPISWSNDGTKLYYVSDLSGKSEIFEHHISSQEKINIANPISKNSWNYFSTASPFENKLLILEFDNYKSTIFKLYNIDNQSVELIHKENSRIDSVAWGKNKNELVFEEKDKSLIKLNIESRVRNVFFQSGKFLGGIARGANGDSFYVGSQQQANGDILVGVMNNSDFEDNAINWQQNSSMIDKHPEFANQSYQIAFVSNRTGVFQLWLKDIDGQLLQLSAFSDDQWFARVAWSSDDKQIIFPRDGNIYIYHFESNKTEQITDFKKSDNQLAYSPSWSSDNQSIYYSVHQMGRYSIWQQYLGQPSPSPKQISEADILHLRESKDGLFKFYTQLNESGIFQFNNQTKETITLLPQLPATTWQSWRISNDGVYYLDISKEDKAVYFYSFETKDSKRMFPWEFAQGPGFSISSDAKYFARDFFVDHESDLLMIKNN